ncbi:glutathione S-transferase family protein [Paracoccus contaminans]|uniref:Glutathione S-transferase n=1 Tax=Paracoccus contaminans TaxID=1945662 RepID=A0A1W6CTS6_9RHOB|nr:glutathione S-transferase family protein [Paracoccus contaminans]ARJ68292.1 glutathione S-transferase [Paracoccus contaminans]
MRLFSMPSSGNSYKVRLLLSLLGRDCAVVDVEDGSDAIEAARVAGRLPFGKAPVLELDDGTLLPESNAILLYLAEGSAWIPGDPVARAQALGWMFWEQNQHEGTVALRGALRFYPHRRHLATEARMAELLDAGHRNLAIMEHRLAGHDWLAGPAPSVADICLYAYTHTAGTRGGFDMDRCPAIDRWLRRIAALPGYRGLDG